MKFVKNMSVARLNCGEIYHHFSPLTSMRITHHHHIADINRQIYRRRLSQSSQRQQNVAIIRRNKGVNSCSNVSMNWLLSGAHFQGARHFERGRTLWLSTSHSIPWYVWILVDDGNADRWNRIHAQWSKAVFDEVSSVSMHTQDSLTFPAWYHHSLYNKLLSICITSTFWQPSARPDYPDECTLSRINDCVPQTDSTNDRPSAQVMAFIHKARNQPQAVKTCLSRNWSGNVLLHAMYVPQLSSILNEIMLILLSTRLWVCLRRFDHGRTSRLQIPRYQSAEIMCIICVPERP